MNWADIRNSRDYTNMDKKGNYCVHFWDGTILLLRKVIHRRFLLTAVTSWDLYNTLRDFRYSLRCCMTLSISDSALATSAVWGQHLKTQSYRASTYTIHKKHAKQIDMFGPIQYSHTRHPLLNKKLIRWGYLFMFYMRGGLVAWVVKRSAN